MIRATIAMGILVCFAFLVAGLLVACPVVYVYRLTKGGITP